MTKASDAGLRKNRIPIMMSDAELAAIDEWMFSQRIRSRAEAIRRLAAEGIIADHKRKSRKREWGSPSWGQFYNWGHCPPAVVKAVQP